MGTSSDQPEVIDSPTGWVAKHIRDYVETEGRKGHRWRGFPTLLLTTTGRKTGQLRRTALIYGRDGDAIVLVASLGGSPKHPLWYLNLVDHPGVTLQIGADVVEGIARVADGEERERLWREMSEIYPEYERYQAKTSRQIPIVVVDPS